MPVVRIAIPDDYQDIVHRLECFELLRGHEVLRFRAPARDLDHQADRLGGAEVVVAIRERTAFPRALLERLPQLKLIALVGRHSSVIDFDACKELGIAVTSGSSASPVAPAELTVALIVASRRNVALEAERMKRGELPATLSHRLRGSTLGIYGLGTIGALVADAGRGLGMKVLVWGRANSLARAQQEGHFVAASKEELFEKSDVLSLQLRLNAETRGIVGAADFARMKAAALFVNTARAELVQPGALLAALKNGRPGYAALDVYEEEPVNPGHPLLGMPNVLCTPHLGWAEWQTFETYFGEAFAHIVRYAASRQVLPSAGGSRTA